MHFLGEVPDGDLPRYYAACDMFLLPNRIDDGDVEGFGIVFLEAAATGRPAIGGRTGGVPEAVVDEETGLLVSGTDVGELAAAIQDLASSKDKRQAMGAAGRERVCRAFTWERAAAEVSAVHAEVAARTHTAAPSSMRQEADRVAVSRRTVGKAKPCVLQLVLDLGPGGTQRLAIEIVKRLSNAFRMVVCCLDDAGDWASELTDHGVPVVPLHRASGFHPSIGARIARLAAEHRATVIHCHHYSPFVYGRIASLLNRRLSLVFTEHGRLSDAPPAMKRKIANSVLGRFSGPVFAVSAALRTHMVAEGFPASRVGVIHNGIDLGHRPTEPNAVRRGGCSASANDEFLVGTAARLDTVKDLPTLVAAIAHARIARQHAQARRHRRR